MKVVFLTSFIVLLLKKGSWGCLVNNGLGAQGYGNDSDTSNSYKTRIVGGHNAALGEVPWMINVVPQPTRNTGGGTLIRKDVVVTSAHLLRYKNITAVTLFAGIINTFHFNGQMKISKEWEIHPGFWSKPDGNPLYDIALVFSSPFNLNTNVKVAWLPVQHSTFSGQFTIAGWGKVGEDKRTSRLKVTNIDYIGTAHCKTYYPYARDGVFCGKTAGIYACHGDSGGPGYKWQGPGKATLFGILSVAGKICGKGHGAVLFVDVRKFLQFIKEKIDCRDREIEFESWKLTRSSISCQGRMDQNPLHKHPNSQNHRRSLMLGGRDARLGEVPWAVLIEGKYPSGKNLHAIGTLIQRSIVITSAHPFFNDSTNSKKDMEKLTANAYAGFVDQEIKDKNKCDYFNAAERLLVIYNYKEIKNDDSPNKNVYENDVAFLVLEKPYTLSQNLEVIELPSPVVIPFGLVTTAGWGSQHPFTYSLAKVLQVANITIAEEGEDGKHCNEYYASHAGMKLPRNILCAGNEMDIRGACLLDDGSPIYITSVHTGEAHLVGMFSFSYPSCSALGPNGVYTSIRKYLPIIKGAMECYGK